MPDQLNQLLSERAMSLISGNFTGVEAPWWWERRMSGGVEICQELDPEEMIRDLAQKTGEPAEKVRRVVERDLGLEDTDPLVLTFEIAGESTEREVAALLAERSSTPQGLAAGVYERVEQAVRELEV